MELSKSSTLVSNLWQEMSENKTSKRILNTRQNKQLHGSRHLISSNENLYPIILKSVLRARH